MPLSLHESRRRSRRQRRWRIFSWLFVFGVLAGLGYGAYATGADLAQRQVLRLQKEIGTLTARIDALNQRTADAQQTASAAEARERDLQQRYEQDVPTGASKELHALVQQRLSDGVKPERLELAIGSVVNEPACDGEPVTKRFLVRTPLYSGANDIVRYAENTIFVTARGESDTDAQGNPRGSFDPAKPVTVRFALLGGKAEETAGMLPLHHSVVTDGAEYRFSVAASDTRGFVQVTGDRCRAPAAEPEADGSKADDARPRTNERAARQ